VERRPPAQVEASPPRLARQQWLDILNNQPDQVPHVFIIGPTGSGKTTFATAMLAERSGRIVVLTAKTDDSWGGLPFVSIDDTGTYTAMQAMFDQLDTDVRARLVASKNKQPVGKPLTIVLDDYAVIAKECKPVAAQVFKLVARLGRSMRVRLVVLSTTGRVKSLDLEGEGDTLTNFISVELNRQREASLVWDTQRYQLDTAHVPSGARQSLAAKQWMPPMMVSSVFDSPSHSPAPRRAADMPRAGVRRYELLDQLLTPAEQQSSRAHAASMVDFADAEQSEHPEREFSALQSTEQSTILPGDREALVRFLVRQGWSANDIVKNVKGDSSTLYPLIARLKNEGNV